MFERCDRELLLRKFPIPEGDSYSDGERFTLFRGVAGSDHRKGMSWTWSLDKAIWYATQHAEYHSLENKAVYAAPVARSEIFCVGDHSDRDFIAHPSGWWRVDVPPDEFRLDRPR